MGSGKSQSAITYMNENTDKNFIYITPYLPEAARIKNGCPEREFIEPSDGIKDFNFSKLEHTHHLIKTKRNITSTHRMFSLYTEETLELIRENKYTLIIDEDVEAFAKAEMISEGDVELLIMSGHLVADVDGITYKLASDNYRGTAFRESFRMLRSHELVKLSENGETKYYFWVFPENLLNSFEDVIIMTYMFGCQDLRYYLDRCGLKYFRIGISANGGEYRFTDGAGYVPEYVKSLRDKINILDDDKLNAVGDNRYALSKNWFSTHRCEVETLKKNVYNYFFNRHKNTKPEEKMWGTYKKTKAQIKGMGYTNSYVVFNQKATNEHRQRKVLAYCANIFMPACKKDYINSLGLQVDQDAYALSIFVQWIWRSAIRDGEPIDLYIPSRRMRELLIGWIEEVNRGRNDSD